MVRLTRNDGYMYPVRVRVTAAGEWIKLSGTVEGFVKDGSAATNAWRPGTTDAQLLLLGVNAKDTEWSIRNVSVEEIQE